jgi:hypothetical protein
MMHAYAHVMQCNYGAKHLRCYTFLVLFLTCPPAIDESPKLMELISYKL